jgi:hypothetical protein
MQTIHINDHNAGTILCACCGRWKTQVFSPLLPINRPLKVKCGCGAIFEIMREFRQAYRKPAHLRGTYRREGKKSAERNIQITDLSQGGVRFNANVCHDLDIDDTLSLTFALDDQKQSTICKDVQVKYIHDHIIGTQFSDADACSYRKEIGFYLMAS